MGLASPPQREGKPLSAGEFRRLNAEAGKRYYIGLEVTINNAGKTHWVGLRSLAYCPGGVEYYAISPTSASDTNRDNIRYQQNGWKTGNGEVFVPAACVTGYVVFEKTE
jgi:hypothetical protein